MWLNLINLVNQDHLFYDSTWNLSHFWLNTSKSILLNFYSLLKAKIDVLSISDMNVGACLVFLISFYSWKMWQWYDISSLIYEFIEKCHANWFFYLRCEWDLKPKISKNKIKSFFNQLNYLAPTLLSHQYIQMVVAQKFT